MPGFPAAAVKALPFTDAPVADRLLVAGPMALLLGFVIDQQVPLERAFSAPAKSLERLGTMTPEGLLAADPTSVERAFAQPPALHRLPRMMSSRVLQLCQVLVKNYHGRPEQLWEGAADAEDLIRRLGCLPGSGR